MMFMLQDEWRYLCFGFLNAHLILLCFVGGRLLHHSSSLWCHVLMVVLHVLAWLIVFH